MVVVFLIFTENRDFRLAGLDALPKSASGIEAEKK